MSDARNVAETAAQTAKQQYDQAREATAAKRQELATAIGTEHQFGDALHAALDTLHDAVDADYGIGPAPVVVEVAPAPVSVAPPAAEVGTSGQ